MEWPHCSRHILQYTFNSIYVYLFVSMVANENLFMVKAFFRPCLETRAITLAHAGTRANYFACVIYRTRKIASNVFFLLLLF